MSLLTDLVSWWDLEEASGSRFDAHGANDLTDNNAVARASGVVGYGADFVEGDGSYLNNTVLNPSGDFTVSLWVYLAVNVSTHFMGKWSGPDNEWLIGSIGDARFWVNDGSSVTVNRSGQALNVGEWNHITCRHVEGDGLYVSVNGANEAYQAHAGGVLDGSSPFFIGNFSDEGTQTIDSVGIWSRSLTAGEVSTLYNQDNGLDYQTVVDLSAESVTLSYTASLTEGFSVTVQALASTRTLRHATSTTTAYGFRIGHGRRLQYASSATTGYPVSVIDGLYKPVRNIVLGLSAGHNLTPAQSVILGFEGGHTVRLGISNQDPIEPE